MVTVEFVGEQTRDVSVGVDLLEPIEASVDRVRMIRLTAGG